MSRPYTDKKLRVQVMIRDIGLCRCCGFKGTQVHHIVPLVYGGEDSTKNMVVLCDTCHRNAPDDKEKFAEYIHYGGARTIMILGSIVQIMENNHLDFKDAWPQAKYVINCLKQIDITNAIEEYGRRSLRLEIDDIDILIVQDKLKGV
jgi:hypothetical protein